MGTLGSREGWYYHGKPVSWSGTDLEALFPGNISSEMGSLLPGWSGTDFGIVHLYRFLEAHPFKKEKNNQSHTLHHFQFTRHI